MLEPLGKKHCAYRIKTEMSFEEENEKCVYCILGSLLIVLNVVKDYLLLEY